MSAEGAEARGDLLTLEGGLAPEGAHRANAIGEGERHLGLFGHHRQRIPKLHPHNRGQLLRALYEDMVALGGERELSHEVLIVA